LVSGNSTIKLPGSGGIATNAATIVLDGPNAKIANGSGADAVTGLTTNAAAGSLTLLGGRTLSVPALQNAGDILLGGRGRDLLIAGTGSDFVYGDGSDDIVIAGYTLFDSHELALMMILDEWQSGRTCEQRVVNLSGVGTGPRLNADYFLIDQTTVFDDNQTDFLIGGGGDDWFFFETGEDLAIVQHDEIYANHLDEILGG